jgi:hypothetical protein
MAATTFKITNYTITLGFEVYVYLNKRNIKTRGKLECYGRHGDRLIIYFLTDDQAAPEPFYNEADKYGAIFLPFKEMPVYVDLVRNEKPVYASLDSDRMKSNSISSRSEPVGEEES